MCEKGRKSVQDGWVLNEVMRPVAAQWKHNGSTELRNVTVIPTAPRICHHHHQATGDIFTFISCSDMTKKQDFEMKLSVKFVAGINNLF